MKQFGKIFVVSLLSCLFFLPHAYAEHPDEGEYQIISAKSGLCLDIKGGSQEAGAQLIQWECNGQENQIFYIQFDEIGVDGEPKFDLIPFSDEVDIYMAIDVPAFSTEEGTGIVQWHYNGGRNQMWAFTPGGEGTYEISNVNSNLCMDVKYPSTAAGETIIQYGCHGGDNQRWILVPVE